MLETCENWLSIVNRCIYHAYQTHEIYQVLPYSVDFKAPRELWNPLSKTPLSKCSLIWNKEPVNIWNDIKPNSNLYVRPVNIFPNFLHCHGIVFSAFCEEFWENSPYHINTALYVFT